VLKEDKEESRKTGNDDDKYDDDELLINLLFLELQLNNKGYNNKDYID
jgi:hypothetical protein